MARLNLFILIFFLCSGIVAGQEHYVPDTIRFYNSSFEDYPRNSSPPIGWQDCGFPGESPVDVQPFRATGQAQWGQSLPPRDGRTYLGMVVRDNETWEKVSQRLDRPVEAGKCYRLEVYLCKSEVYISQSRKTGREVYYNEPAVLKIWGSTGLCGRSEVLATSGTIDNTNWQVYSFEFRPRQSYRFITFEAFYKTPVLIPYNGNILMDKLSPIIRIPCPEEEVAVASNDEFVTESSPEEKEEVRESRLAGATNKHTEEEDAGKDKAEPLKKPEEKILKDLDSEKIRVGHTIRIERLQFKADTAVINDEAHPVLNEIAYFLINNPDVRVEIGGHTSYRKGMEKQDYSEKLSKARAKAVVKYLVDKGVPEVQLKYRGYGYSKPIATNFSSEGRKRNQRVELRIIEISDR